MLFNLLNLDYYCCYNLSTLTKIKFKIKLYTRPNLDIFRTDKSDGCINKW